MNAAASARALIPEEDNTTLQTAFPPLPEGEVVVVRPSDISDMDACSFKHGLRRAGVRPTYLRSNLAFGTIMHSTVEVYVTGEVTEADLPDFFGQAWDNVRKGNEIRYSSTESFNSLDNIGRVLARMFPKWWKQSGFRVFRMPGGEFSVEQRLTVQLAPTVILSTQPDLIVECVRTITDKGYVLAQPGDIAVLDVKTPKAASGIEFSQRSTQLTYAKIAVEANRPKLGLSREVKGVGYLELMKKKTPEIVPPFLYERPVHLVNDAIRKAISVAERIRCGDYVRTSGMAFNSPCQMCDYAEACLSGDGSELTFPDGLTAVQLMR